MAMENKLFAKLLEQKEVKTVPLSYIIVIFSAIQDILEQEKIVEQMM